MFCRFVASVCLGLSMGAISVASDATLCPPRIDVQQQLETPVSGWTPIFDGTPHQLAGVTLYDGTPQEKASLVYDDIKKTGGKQVASWTFEPNSSRPTWVVCSYSGTNIQLSKALPASTRSCQVTYDPSQQVAGMPSIEKIVCK